MEMIPVTSSQFTHVGYDADKQDLAIQFIGSGTYTYHGVPAEEHAAFMAAESAGKYFHANIRPVYHSTRPDGTACPPTVKAAKAETAAAPVPTVGKAIETPKPADTARVDTWAEFVGDMGHWAASYMPRVIDSMSDLHAFAGHLAEIESEIAAEEAEADRRLAPLLRQKEALLRYYGPQAERITAQIIASINGQRKSVDTSTHRFSLTAVAARIEIVDPEATLPWAEEHLPGVVTVTPAFTVAERRSIDFAALSAAFKSATEEGAGVAALPPGVRLIPATERFAIKPITKAAEPAGKGA